MSRYISIQERLNPSCFKVIRVYNKELMQHMKRNGFDLIGEVGDENVSKPTQYTMYGDIRRITAREEPFIEYFGKLKKRSEHFYGATQRQ
jgi:hypothetical protein